MRWTKKRSAGAGNVGGPKARHLVWNVPVGLQLSLLYALLFTVTLALLGWALYGQLEGFLVQNTAERLSQSTRPTLLRSFPPRGERGGPPASHSPQDPVEAAATQLVDDLSRSDVAVAVLNSEGVVINYTQSISADEPIQIPAISGEWIERLKNGSLTQPAQWIVAAPGSERQLVVLTPLALRSRDGSSEIPLYLEQAISLGGADAILNQLRLYIALGIVVGSAIGVVAGLALTRTILRPLDRMVRTAEAIAGGDLDRRLRLPDGRNEVARLGSAFDHMVDRLGASLEAQRRFVADASHELRTPLTSMEGLSEMLLMGADRGDTKVIQRTVRSIHSELGRLGRLVTDLLTLSRLDSTVPVKFVPLDAGKLVGEVAEQIGPMAEAKGVRLMVDCPAPAPVQGDPDRLKQVVLNLVDNAVRYTPAGGEVRLRAVADTTEGEVRIEVLDTGPGIAPQDLSRIFDRFYRGDTSRDRATGNTGLGLAIARAIVNAHAGTITVDSILGAGATFRVTLPSHGEDEHQAPLAVRKIKARRPDEQTTPQGVT